MKDGPSAFPLVPLCSVHPAFEQSLGSACHDTGSHRNFPGHALCELSLNEPHRAYLHKNAVTGECAVSHTIACHQDVSPSLLWFLHTLKLYLTAGLQGLSCFVLVPLFTFTPFTASVKSSFVGCFLPLKLYCSCLLFLPSASA